jgi:hypothetical protein
MSTEQIVYKIKHIPTGLFYGNAIGRFKSDKTNLTKNGKIYNSEKLALNSLNSYCKMIYVNKTQIERFNLSFDETAYYMMNCKVEDFVIVKYMLKEIENENTTFTIK